MPALLVLSLDGQSFIYQCPHCLNQRSESVNPSINPYPFSYLPNCSSCGETLNIDTDVIHSIQQSYARAAGQKIPDASERTPGSGGGDKKCTGSPEYLAINRASAAIARVAGAGLEPATS